MTPEVSVVIATYNYGRFLGGALESVLNQTFTNFEVIVVDDGSKDNTRHVAEHYLADRRVRYVYTDHVGQPQAKNTGIRLATAPFIAFLDADDLWMSTKLERQIALFRADPDLGVVYCRRLQIDEEGWQLAYRQPKLYRGMVLEPMFQGNFVCFSSCVVGRNVFDRIGLFDERLALAIDYDLWLRAAIAHRFDYVDEPLVQYRVGHANLSQRAEERLRTACKIMDRFLNEYGGRSHLSRDLVRKAQAETYCHIALARRQSSHLGALTWYTRALSVSPALIEAWRGMASLFVPEAGRRCLRRLLGRPIDWRMRVRVGRNSPGLVACSRQDS